MDLMKEIKEKSDASVEMAAIESTHHFHMLKPEETSQIALKFLGEKVVFFIVFSDFIGF